MTGDDDVRAVLEAADRAADVAERGWRDYSAQGPRRVAGLATAVTVGCSIPMSLRSLRPLDDRDDWAEIVAVFDGAADTAWLARLRAELWRPGVDPSALTSPDGRTIDTVFPTFLSAMRMLIAAANERFGAVPARGY